MSKQSPTDEDLRLLGKRWFAEARELTEQETAELRAWNKERRRRTAGADSGGFFSSDADSCGGDGGGGD